MTRALVLLVSLSALACRSPTQITFAISTDKNCGDVKTTSLTAGPLAALTDNRPPTTTAPPCTTGTHIGSLVAVPSGADDELVAVRIVTGVSVPPDQCGPQGQGCIVSKRALRFVPHSPLVVNVGMDGACEGVYCPGEETCVDGVCRSALIDDPTQCEGAGCDDTLLGPAGGGPLDGGPTTDATLPSDGASPIEASADAPGPALDGAGVTATSIGISVNFACALLSDHTVACWGHDDVGELGNGTEDDASYAPTPVRVPGLDHVARLAVGESHACVVLDDAGVSCWGFGGYGATGTNDGVDDLVPTHVGVEAAGLIAAGQYETCVGSVDGHRIWCWGIYQDEYDGTDAPTLVPAVQAGLVELSAGRAITCGRFDDSVVRCWGQNGYDVLGQGGALPLDASTLTPLAVSGVPNPKQISVAMAHACVLDTSRTLRCWGENDGAELGPIDAGDSTGTPLPLGVDPDVSKVTCAADSTCILYGDAGVACWGYDLFGELGIPDSVDESKYTNPVTIPNLGPAVDLFSGGNGHCAILVDAGVACWGNDQNLQLGAGAQLPAMPVGAFPVSF